MSAFDKLFGLFNKADQALSQAQRMQGTVDRVEYQGQRVSQTSSKVKWIILVVILVLAVLYIFFAE